MKIGVNEHQTIKINESLPSKDGMDIISCKEEDDNEE
jgi:hypothetical protein